MSNILERHLEQNIEPNTSKESYIDKAIQIFQDMKEEDIETSGICYKSGNKYCLNGLFAFMNGHGNNGPECADYSKEKLGMNGNNGLTEIHIEWTLGRYNFETMRTKAISYMESLK